MYVVVAGWHFLYINGFWGDIIMWCVTAMLSWLWVHRLWKKSHHTQKRIADLLDTSTPGGLTDVMDRLHNAPEAENKEVD